MEIEIVSRNVSLSGIICYNILRSRENGASSQLHSALYSIEVLYRIGFSFIKCTHILFILHSVEHMYPNSQGYI